MKEIYRDWLIIIPAHNEAATIEAILEQVWRLTGARILVVDDGSTDATSRIAAAAPGTRVLRHDQRLGYGQSLRDGLGFAIREGCGYALTMDADGQHDPAEIPLFLPVVERADIASGTRYHPLSPCRSVPVEERLLINREITSRVNTMTGYGITDAFCGFKAYRTGAIARMSLTENGYGMPLQVWIQARALDLVVEEVPVSLIYGPRHPVDWGQGFAKHNGIGDADRLNFRGEFTDAAHRLRAYHRILEHEAGKWFPAPFAGENK